MTSRIRNLYTLAYPDISDADADFIVGFRHTHDLPNRDAVGAHFTLAFGCTAVDEADYLLHVAAIASECPSIPFDCKYAMLGADAEDETAYVFLVPDQGYANLSLLHDRLYTGLLAPHLRLDVPYIPHITIGTLTDRTVAKSLCDGLNSSGVSIQGRVNSITVGALESGRISNIASFRLGH